MVVNSTNVVIEPIAEGGTGVEGIIENDYIWSVILSQSNQYGGSKPELSELFKKILRGMNNATRKLVEESAANGRSLVISEDGEVKRIPAKDLLPRVSGNG